MLFGYQRGECGEFVLHIGEVLAELSLGVFVCVDLFVCLFDLLLEIGALVFSVFDAVIHLIDDIILPTSIVVVIHILPDFRSELVVVCLENLKLCRVIESVVQQCEHLVSYKDKKVRIIP